MKSLHLFVNSERPDQYLNSLVHCVLRHDVRKVIFVHIKGLDDAEQSSLKGSGGLSARLMGAVQAQLEGLAERGEYLFKDGPHSGERVLLKNEYTDLEATHIQAYYANCRNLSISYSNDELEYTDLRTRLSDIAKDGREAYVDVTAIKKRYLGDLVAAALIEGLRGLYTFDLLGSHKPDFDRPWRTLLHALESAPAPAFRYTNILDTEIYRECAGSARQVRPAGGPRTLKQFIEEHPIGVISSTVVTSCTLAGAVAVWIMTGLNSSFHESINSRAGDVLAACGLPGTTLPAGPEDRLREAVRMCGLRIPSTVSAGPSTPVPTVSVRGCTGDISGRAIPPRK